MESFNRQKLTELVKRCSWTWASTMKGVPHEYIHRDHCALSRDEFYYIVRAQREIGIKERWGRYNFPYLYLDGYKYWTMGDPFATTWILNRQKVFNEFDFLEWPIPRTYTMPEADIMQRTILSSFLDKSIFECGIGNGDFVRLSKINPQNYYGVDPSKTAIKMFRENNIGFYKRCSTISFEEAYNQWLSAESVVIGLFGSASYFMKQYLGELNKSGLDYCLMFYREDYRPKEFAEMHCFDYTKEELKIIFPRAYMYDHKNFHTVSSKKLFWQQTLIENELFS